MSRPNHSPATPKDSPALPGKRSGLLRALFALEHSYRGLRITFRSESAFRQETALAVVLVPCALMLPVSLVERAMMIGSVLLVLLVELLNSAIEAVVDRISLERHELSGRAKDCGSAAVLISLIICALTWGAVVWPLAKQWLHPRA